MIFGLEKQSNDFFFVLGKSSSVLKLSQNLAVTQAPVVFITAKTRCVGKDSVLTAVSVLQEVLDYFHRSRSGLCHGSFK